VWLLLGSTIAFAGAVEPLARVEQPLRVRRYRRVTQNQSPRPSGRSRTGPFRVWTWPDGTIEHYDELRNARVVRTVRYNPDGTIHSSLFYREDTPHHILIHGASTVEVDLTDWVTWESPVGPIRVPGMPAVTESGIARWTLPWGSLSLQVVPGEDLYSDALAEGIATNCGCSVLHRTPVWVSGQTGIRYQSVFVHPTTPRSEETWILPSGDGRLILIAASAQEVTETPGALATARATVSLLPLESSP
jgi:hypothetical protein